jgi:hypothetical protein
MTPRTALLVALIGLVIASVCAIPLYFIDSLDPANDDAVTGIILLNLTGILGLIIMAVGLIMAVAIVLRGKHRQSL